MIKVKCRGHEGYLAQLLSDAFFSFFPGQSIDGTIHGSYDIEIFTDNKTKIALFGVDSSEIEFVR